MYKEKVANTTAPPSADVANRMFAAIQKGDIQEVQKLVRKRFITYLQFSCTLTETSSTNQIMSFNLHYNTLSN